jgi:hypothetical protein
VVGATPRSGDDLVLRLLELLAPYVVWLYPIGVVVLLIYLRAWILAGRDLRASIFSLEREMAVGRMRRAAAGALACFGLLVGLFVTQVHFLANLDIAGLIKPTPTHGFMPTSLYASTPGPGTPTTAEAGPTPMPTSTRRPSPRPVTLVPSPTARPASESEPEPEPENVETPAPPPSCPDPNVQITQPGQGARITGRVDIRGTANIPGFQFYKIELGLGEQPSRWTTINDVRRNPVTGALLEVWDTSDLPAGSYSLRLVVVDATGNFPPPCEVLVHVTR